MKLRHKLILGYLLVATLASLTTYFTIGSYRNIKNAYGVMVRDPLPAIKSLEGIKQGGTRIVSSTTEFGFIHNEMLLANEIPDESEEKNELMQTRLQYDQFLQNYKNLISASSSEDVDNFCKIEASGEALIKTSLEIIKLKEEGVVGEQVLEKKEEFERNERAFLQLVEEVKEKEYRELAHVQEEIEATIAVSTRNTLIVTFFTFLLAILSGIYISRLIARRIVELKEASQKVSVGELDTMIDIKSDDEVGELGRSFNKMIGDLKEYRCELLSSKKFVDNIFASMPDILIVINLDGTINRVNRGMLELTGYTEEEVLGKQVFSLSGNAEFLPSNFFPELKKKSFITGFEQNCRTKNGIMIPVSLSVSVLRNPDSKAIGFVCVGQNISERKRLENKLTHQALHDPLTGLANRLLFNNRVEHSLQLTRRYQMSLAVLFLDLDNFKNINDSLGHAVGDELLKGVAERLESCLRASDTAARLGGDEFAILLEQLTNSDYAVMVAERIIERFHEPFIINGKEIFIQTSIGIALTENFTYKSEELLRNADVAMYMSKSKGKGCLTVFENQMHKDLIYRLEFEADLRLAVENKEFLLFFQPIVEFKSEKIRGIEALVRWQHPKRGLVMPLDFIPIAEETGLIIPLGRWILEHACRQARAWQTEFPDKEPLSITVNLSGRQFQNPEIVETVAAALKASGLPPELLVLEITESMMLQNTESMIERLQQLKRLGVRLAIDDFGTGYSSLSYLHRFPIDIIKIDRSFIKKLEETTEDGAVTRAIIMMSESLRLKTIAEGIESLEQRDILQKMGCEFGQGYLFAKPLNENEFIELLKRPAGDNCWAVGNKNLVKPTPKFAEAAEPLTQI